MLEVMGKWGTIFYATVDKFLINRAQMRLKWNLSTDWSRFE
jgi:hypothetical protein